MNKLRLQQKRQVMDLIREYFVGRGFFELETPLLVCSPGMEVHLHSFKTSYVDHQNNEQNYYLPTSPEFAIKKALGSGFEKVFEIARVFRNHGELGKQHHPEFNMLEWYRPGNYESIMEDVAELLKHLASSFESLTPQSQFSWEQGVKRSSIEACFEQYARLDLQKGMNDLDYWKHAGSAVLNEIIPDDDSFEDMFFRVWMKLIEPKLGRNRPEIVYDYPAKMAALSRLKEPENIWAERFELYIQGMEVGNAFSELTDSREQERRFLEANTERMKLGYEPHPLDTDLIRSVGQMQATGGIAMGLERLLMTLTGEEDIREFFLHPVADARRKKKVKDDLDPSEPSTTLPS